MADNSALEYAASGGQLRGNRHLAPRHRTLKGGKIIYAEGAISAECIIRDLSAQGAKIKLISEVPVPDKFTLEVLSENMRVECEVRWKEHPQIGCVFTSPIQFFSHVKRQIVRDSDIGRKSSIIKRGK